jgi:hypothetical protein
MGVNIDFHRTVFGMLWIIDSPNGVWILEWIVWFQETVWYGYVTESGFFFLYMLHMLDWRWFGTGRCIHSILHIWRRF